MADETVTPDAFEIALTLQTITLPGAIHMQYSTTFQVALTLPPVSAICSFPRIGRKPGHRFGDETTKEAVSVGSTASGYPVFNKLFTFDPRTFSLEYHLVTDADKLIVMNFYDTHKDLSFPWYNDQNHSWYETGFVAKPKCRIDGRRDLWRINLELIQTSP